MLMCVATDACVVCKAEVLDRAVLYALFWWLLTHRTSYIYFRVCKLFELNELWAPSLSLLVKLLVKAFSDP